MAPKNQEKPPYPCHLSVSGKRGEIIHVGYSNDTETTIYINEKRIEEKVLTETEVISECPQLFSSFERGQCVIRIAEIQKGRTFSSRYKTCVSTKLLAVMREKDRLLR
ncbi:MAG: hypothetical protein ACOY3I_02025 [Verrucomicrobiota bacterium]